MKREIESEGSDEIKTKKKYICVFVYCTMRKNYYRDVVEG